MAVLGVARDRGFALLVVLWSLVLVGLLTTQILASARTALLLAGNLRAAAQAKAAADGAIDEAIFHLSATGTDRWIADGSLHILGDPGLPVTVRANSLAGKINPNLASAGLLAGLFQAVGAAPPLSAQLAAEIIEWRKPAANRAAGDSLLAEYQHAGMTYAPPGRHFADLGELDDVIGMPPALLLSALPHLSLFQSAAPDPSQADPAVREALALSGQALSGTVMKGPAPVVSIEAVAGLPGELAIHREAIVSLTGHGFKILSLTD